jgi:hypothetical protein
MIGMAAKLLSGRLVSLNLITGRLILGVKPAECR